MPEHGKHKKYLLPYLLVFYLFGTAWRQQGENKKIADKDFCQYTLHAI